MRVEDVGDLRFDYAVRASFKIVQKNRFAAREKNQGKFVGNKVPRFLISLVKPFRVKTLLKLPFVKLDEQMISMVDRYLQTIKK